MKMEEYRLYLSSSPLSDPIDFPGLIQGFDHPVPGYLAVADSFILKRVCLSHYKLLKNQEH